MPIFFKVVRIVGQVPSPTPTMPMVSLSIKVICRSARWRAAMIPAVSHPAVPPPTMQIDRTGLTMPRTAVPASEPRAHADLESASTVLGIEELVLIISVLHQVRIGQIDALHEHSDVVVDVIGGAGVQLV